MAGEKVSYRDLYPHFAEYVENPDITDEPVKEKDLYNLLEFWETVNDHFPFDTDIDSFLSSIAEWSRRVKEYENYESHIYDNYDIEDETQNTRMLIRAITLQLNEIETKRLKCNFLLGIKKEIDQGCYFPALVRDYSEIGKFVSAELEYWINYVDEPSSRNSADNKTEPKNLDQAIEVLKDLEKPRSAKAKKMVMLLHELGIIDHLDSYYKLERNYTRIGRIMKEFLDVEVGADTIRTYIEGIKKPSATNKQNNPYNNDSRRIWLDVIMTKLDLPKDDKDYRS